MNTQPKGLAVIPAHPQELAPDNGSLRSRTPGAASQFVSRKASGRYAMVRK